MQQSEKWIIGCGRGIKFWKDAWVVGLPGGRITSCPPTMKAAQSCVRDWRTDDNEEWDVAALEQHLSREEVEAVKGTYIAASDQEDILAWKHTKRIV